MAFLERSAASLAPLDRPGAIAIIVARFSIHEAVLVSRAVLAPYDRHCVYSRCMVQPIQIFRVASINAHNIEFQCIRINQSHSSFLSAYEQKSS